jgi:Rod binding domain-containing protein
MNVAPTSPNQPLPDVPIESLAANRHLSEREKIAVASQQFEALLLKQVLAESQKPVFKSEFTDNSTAAGIYQDMISGQLAQCLAKSDAIGLAKSFAGQLNQQSGTTAAAPDQVASATALSPAPAPASSRTGLWHRLAHFFDSNSPQ